MREHLLERDQARLKFHAQTVLLFAPLLKAMAPKFSLLEPPIVQLIGPRHELFEVGVVQLEGEGLDIVFNVAPHNVLQAIQIVGEQAKL